MGTSTFSGIDVIVVFVTLTLLMSPLLPGSSQLVVLLPETHVLCGQHLDGFSHRPELRNKFSIKAWLIRDCAHS